MIVSGHCLYCYWILIILIFSFEANETESNQSQSWLMIINQTERQNHERENTKYV